MQIAMKIYLRSLIFFLLFFGWESHSAAQDTLSSEEPALSFSSLAYQANEHQDGMTPSHEEHPSISDEMMQNLEHPSDNFQAKFFSMLLILALLIAFMVLASWALKRLMKTKISQRNTGSEIKILETRYLSPRATLYLVEIHNHTILMAESPTSVSFLTEIPQVLEQTDSSRIPSTYRPTSS